MVQTLDIPIAHVTEAGSVVRVIEALQALHGPAYDLVAIPGFVAPSNRIE
jgi:hypothetical protein